MLGNEARSRTIAILATCVLLYPAAHAQNWFPDEAVWHYDYDSFFGTVGHVRVVVEGDTIIEGGTLRKLRPVREEYSHISGQFFTQHLPVVPVWEGQGLALVWSHTEQTLDTLCDINALPGDRWRLPRVPDWRVCADSSFMEVMDTGTVQIGGVPLRWLAVEVHFLIANMPGWPPPIQDTLIERIGTTALYMLAHDVCNAGVDGHEGGPFRCYSDNEVFLQRGPDLTCDFIVGMQGNGMAQAGALLLHPNPASAWVAIDYDLLVEPTHAAIVIRDIAGREVKRIALREQQQQVVWDTRQMAPGTYVATLYHGQRALRTEKIVLQP